ncbi:uncharacterized protein LOC127368350, partial [Scomber scombrus]
MAEDDSESEEHDYVYYPPGETLNTDCIETRLLTRPETVPLSERHLEEIKQPTLPSVGTLPVPVNLEGKAETSIIEQQDREKRHAPERETVQRIPVEVIPSKSEKPLALRDGTPNEPSSDKSNCSGWIGNSAVVDAEAEVISEHREIHFPKARRVLFGSSQDITSDIPMHEDETLPVQLLESPSEPNIMNESLPVCSDLSFSDSSKDEECFVNEPCEEA